MQVHKFNPGILQCSGLVLLRRVGGGLSTGVRRDGCFRFDVDWIIRAHPVFDQVLRCPGGHSSYGSDIDPCDLELAVVDNDKPWLAAVPVKGVITADDLDDFFLPLCRHFHFGFFDAEVGVDGAVGEYSQKGDGDDCVTFHGACTLVV